MSSSPNRRSTRFQLQGAEVAPATSRSQTSSPSTASTRSRTSPATQPQQLEDEQPKFTIHPLLQTSQEVIAEGIASHILWDVREEPWKALYVEQLSKQLTEETLNEFATTPPLPFLKIVCEFPQPWECYVTAGNKQPGGGAGYRGSVPVYPPPPARHIHNRSPSAPVAQPQARHNDQPPPRPMLPPVPLPLTSPPPAAAISNVVLLPPVLEVPQPRVVGITIGDLLHAVYDYLDRHIRAAEFESLPKKQQDLVEEAAEKRRMSVSSPTRPSMPALSPTSPVAAFSVGVAPSTSSTVTRATSSGPDVERLKRVDRLMKHRWFAGLTVAPGKHTVSLTLKAPTPNI